MPSGDRQAMLWLSFLVVLLVVLLTRRWKTKRLVELSKKLKSRVKSYPLVGIAYLFIGNGKDRFNGLVTIGRESLAHGGMVAGWFGQNLYISVADPHDLSVIMKSALNKGNEMRILRTITGNGLIFAPVHIWRPRRKVIAPIFSQKNLNNFVDIFARQSAITVQQMSPIVSKGMVSVWKYITSYTLDAICETTMNVKLNSQQSSDVPFLKAVSDSTNLVASRVLKPWLHSDAIYKLLPKYRELILHKRVLDNFIYEAIKRCRKNMMDDKKVAKQRTKNLVQLIIESSGGQSKFSDLELQEEAMVMVIAGNDTSAVATCFVLSMMARHPDVQDKVAEELHAVFGESDRPVTADDLPHLKYLEVVIKETLRLYPPVPVVTRLIERDIVLPSGITLVSGCTVLVHIWAVHRNQKYWGEDAELFRPERFIETPTPTHPAAFMPFSHGPRNCLGAVYAMMSIKSALSTILRSYRVLNTDNGDKNISQKPMTITFEIMMKDVDEWKIRLEKRTTNSPF